jgi:hypothetical protein
MNDRQRVSQIEERSISPVNRDLISQLRAPDRGKQAAGSRLAQNGVKASSNGCGRWQSMSVGPSSKSADLLLPPTHLEAFFSSDQS